MKLLLLSNLVLLGGIQNTGCSCTFPSDWSGSWFSSEFGNGEIVADVISSTILSGWNITSFYSWTCQNSSGNILLFHADQTVPGTGFTVGAIRCIQWTKLTEFSYSYIIYNDLDPANGYRVQLATTPLSTSIQTSCAPTTNPAAEEFHVLVKTVSSLSVYIDCPSVLQGIWTYEHHGLSTTSCGADSSLTVCGTTMKFNYRKCNKTQAFSENGEVNCIYTKMDNVSQQYFTIVYNADENVDSLTTHRFTCFAFVQNESVIQASDSAGSCEASQTATNQQTDGSGTLLIQKSGVCPISTTSDDQTGVIVGSVLGVISFIVCIAIVLYTVIRRKKRLRQSVKHKDQERQCRHTPRNSSDVNLVKDSGTLSWKQIQPVVEKPQTWMKTIMRIIPLQRSNTRSIENAVVSGRWTRKIFPDTPDPGLSPPDQFDKVTSDLDNKLIGSCNNCKQTNCICKINQHLEENDNVENESEDEVTDSPSESNRVNSDADLKQGVIKSNLREHFGERDIPETVKTPDTLTMMTDSTHTISNDFAYSSKLNKKQTVEGNRLITMLSERDPKGIFNEGGESTDTDSGVRALEERSERNNELQSVVNHSVTGNGETENRETFKTVDEATIAEKHDITDGQADAKPDEENNASNVNKRDESLAGKIDQQLPGVKLHFPPPSSSRRTSDTSKVQNTFKSKKTLFQVNDDVKDHMAPGALDEQTRSSILLSDFPKSKGGQKTVSFEM